MITSTEQKKTPSTTSCSTPRSQSPQKPTPPKKITTNKLKTTSTQKRATFTYVGKETTYTTNLFKNTDLKISMCTNNAIQNILMHNKQLTNKRDKYTQSGVYKLTCRDCNKAYVGQIGKKILARCNEHKNAFRTSSQNSNFAKNLIEQTHTLSAPSKTICRCYNARTKEHASIPLNDTTFTQSIQKTITSTTNTL